MDPTVFTPTSRTVTSGTTVHWLNDSNVIHNVTFANPTAAGVTNIPEHSSGTNSRVFTAVGTHAFECTIHFGMTGSVVVQ
jgi:plastocyanin